MQMGILLGWMSALAAMAASLGDVKPDPRTPYFTLESAVSVGGKGEEALDVSVEADCGDAAWLFQRAELVVTRNRFGDVQFVGLPAPGCVHCAPVELRWFHEPTGYLSFQVNIYRRLEIVSCPMETQQQERG